MIFATVLVCGFLFESSAVAQQGSRGSQDLYTLIEQAQAHVVAGRWQAAINVYLDAWKVSRDPGYLYNISVLYLVRLKDEAKALDYAEKYSEQARSDSEKMEAEGLMRRIRDSIKGTHGRIVVDVLPKNADSVVYVDNKELGEDNWVRAGAHTLGVQAPGYVPFSKEIQVVAGTETSFSIQLKTIEGQVSVRCLAGPCKVLVDGDEIGHAPVQKTLSPGEHSVEVDSNGNQLFSDWVVIESGMQSSLVVSVDTGRTEVSTDIIGEEPGLAVVEGKQVEKPKTDDAGQQWARNIEQKAVPKSTKIGPQKAAAISMWVLSACAVGAGTAMYFMAQNELDNAAALKPADYPGHYSYYEWYFDDYVSKGKMYSYVAYGGWGLSGVAFAIGMALWFTAPADTPVAVVPSGPEGPGATMVVRW